MNANSTGRVTDRPASAAGIAAYLRAGAPAGSAVGGRRVGGGLDAVPNRPPTGSAARSTCRISSRPCCRAVIRSWWRFCGAVCGNGCWRAAATVSTAAALAQADPAAVARIPYVTPAAATRLVAAAAASVADQTDPATGRGGHGPGGRDRPSAAARSGGCGGDRVGRATAADPGVQIIDAIPASASAAPSAPRLELGISTAFLARRSWWRLPD